MNRERPARTQARADPVSREAEDGLGRLKGVSLEVSVELARMKAKLGDVLALGPGSIVSFAPPDTGRAEVLIGRKLVAFGEPVAVDEQVGVRITGFLSTPQSG